MSNISLFENSNFQISKYQKTFIMYLIYYMILFCVPIIVPTIIKQIPYINYLNKYNQILIGIIVNITLIRMAINSKSYTLPIIGCTLPSLSTLPLGLVGTITLPFKYTCYMIPFIWLGNISLVLIFKFLFKNKKKNYSFVSIISLIVKPIIIFSSFSLLSYSIGLINTFFNGFKNMMLAMSLYQIITLSIATLLNTKFAINYRKINNYERL
ncbi:MAG: hypothetical protein J6Y96_01730 [Mycoplasma sp.]|nr:hypothetical protein [Mycoplasma sp.]